jgi:hypothetical protein
VIGFESIERSEINKVMTNHQKRQTAKDNRCNRNLKRQEQGIGWGHSTYADVAEFADLMNDKSRKEPAAAKPLLAADLLLAPETRAEIDKLLLNYGRHRNGYE